STCGITMTNDAYCWGSGSSLGANGPASSMTPVPVAGGHKFTMIIAAPTACGLTTTNDVYCWGANNSGQTGSGNFSLSPLQGPVQVAGGLKFTTITGNGSSYCGLTSTGTMYCWGYNGLGQLGIGQDETQSSPSPTTGAVFRVRPPR